MNRTTARVLVVFLLVASIMSSFVHAQGFRSIGVRIALSWSETPIWMGIEAATDTPWSVLTAALFVTPDGKTLFTAHVDLPLQEAAATFFRITGGFYYFDPTQPFPYPLLGAGLSTMASSISPLYVGFAGEFIYPLAFPLPLFSISGGWLP